MKLDKKYRILLQGALIFVWLTDLSPLTQTDTYYSVYLLCGLFGLACLLANRRQEKQPLAVKIFSGLLQSGMLTSSIGSSSSSGMFFFLPARFAQSITERFIQSEAKEENEDLSLS